MEETQPPPKKYAGFYLATGPDDWRMTKPITGDSPRPCQPQDLPTYARVIALHCGDPEMEVRMRAASLLDTLQHLEGPPLPPPGLTEQIFKAGAITPEEAEALEGYIDSMGKHDTYLRDEALLLMEAGGHIHPEAHSFRT